MMHIAIDGKRFFLNNSGLGRYSRGLVESLMALEEEALRITLFRPKGKVSFEAPENKNLRVVTADYLLSGDIGNAFWRFYKLPDLIARGGYTLFHGPSHVVPGRIGCPAIVTMLDLIFLRFPEYFPIYDRNYYKYIFRKSALRADHIISISEATKADLVNYFHVPPEKISVIYPAGDEGLSALDETCLASIKSKFDLPDTYILYVGNIEPRKNIFRLAQAFDRLMTAKKISEKTRFLIVGRKGWFTRKIFSGIDKLENRDNIRFVGPAYGQDLSGIYQMATVMAYPSLFEGFGYPVLEAMQMGTPVLTSNISSMPEAGGDAACLVDPREVEDIADGLETFLTNEQLRQDYIQKGRLHAAQFTAERMARQTLDVYRKFS